MGRRVPSELREITVFDSTLRDGEQAPGNAMLPEQKLKMALQLEALGVNTIEAGFPSSSPNDFRAIQLISQGLTSAKMATLNRALRRDISVAAEAGGVLNHQLQILASGSDIHLRHKRMISREEGIGEIVGSVRFARSIGFTDITLAVEDASRGTDDLLRPLMEAALEQGVTTIMLADTTGCMIPAQFGELVARVRSWVPSDVVLSTHCHEDLGLSLANALAGIEAGADEVQATLAGIGERAGNTSLEELAAVLTYHAAPMGVTTRLRTEGIFGAFETLRGFTNLPHPRNKAILGQNAFSTQAGIHQSGMLRNPVTYEYAEPTRFGRRRSILVGRHSGRDVVRHVLEGLGRPVNARLVDDIYEMYVVSNSDGRCIDLEDLSQQVGLRLALSQSAAVRCG
jgi:2-isopropylmalate synthase